MARTQIFHGQAVVVTAGTRVQLGTGHGLRFGVTVRANAGNGGEIYVGGPAVSAANGHILAAGDAVFLEIRGPADIYVDSDTNGDGVSYIGT